MAASPSGGKAGLGWLVLAAALAVPSFLFYNWWSHMKADRSRALVTKARSRLPEGAVFQTPPDAPRLANPLAVSTSPVAAAAVAPAAPPPAPPVAAAPPPAPPAAVPAHSTMTAAIVLPRDPMLSPMDLVRIREEEMAKERSRLELEEANRRRTTRRAVKHVEPPVEDHINLQGTVAIPNGSSLAIVNNATMTLGESFAVEGYSAKVRIVKISAAGVTFEYKKRRFTKTVNEE